MASTYIGLVKTLKRISKPQLKKVYVCRIDAAQTMVSLRMFRLFRTKEAA